MHEIKPHSAHLAEMQARRTPSTDEKLSALEGSLAHLIHRFDAVVSRKDDAHRDDDKRDDRRRYDDDDDARFDRIGRMISDAVAREFDRRDRKRREDEQEGTEPEPMSADDDRARDDIGSEPEHEHVEEMREAAEGQHEKMEDDRRGDSATISRLRNEVAELRRGMKRVITDDDLNKLAEKQSEWDRVAMLHGHRASRPLDGERVASYDRRMAKVYQKHSPKWKGQDLSSLPIEVVTKIAAPEIRADSVAHAYAIHPSDGGMQREVRRQDQSGRWISEFVGPVGAVNGALAPFRMQPYRCRVNPDPSKYS